MVGSQARLARDCDAIRRLALKLDADDAATFFDALHDYRRRALQKQGSFWETHHLAQQRRVWFLLVCSRVVVVVLVVV